MKGTQEFEAVIQAYLDRRAADDALFAQSYAKEGKSVKECCVYIIDQVHQLGVSGMADDEVYSLAVHYYDEDGLAKPASHKCDVVVNRHIELTEAEKEEARSNAKLAYEREYKDMLRRQAEPPKTAPKLAPKTAKAKTEMPVLFDFDEL